MKKTKAKLVVPDHLARQLREQLEKNGNEIRVSVVGDVNNIKMPHEIQLEENRKIISEYRRIAYRHWYTKPTF